MYSSLQISKSVFEYSKTLTKYSQNDVFHEFVIDFEDLIPILEIWIESWIGLLFATIIYQSRKRILWIPLRFVCFQSVIRQIHSYNQYIYVTLLSSCSYLYFIMTHIFASLWSIGFDHTCRYVRMFRMNS